MEQSNIEQSEEMSLEQKPQGPVAPVEKPQTRIFIILGLLLVLILTVATIWIVLKYNPPAETVENAVTAPVVVEEKPSSDEQAGKLNTQGTSTEISEIQKDLDITSLDSIDSELEGLENLLQ